MMKNYFLLAILMISFQMFSQEFYLNTGKNLTQYIYKNSFGQTKSDIQNGIGNFYEVGLTKPLLNKKLFYSFGISFNEYNAVGGDTANNYRWDTNYLGVTGGMAYSFFPNNKKLNFLFNVEVKGATIIYGKQEINNVFYDLVNNKEFSGIMLEPSVGFQFRYSIPSFGSFSVGYNYCDSFRITNITEEKLSFHTNQIQLGFHFPIN